MQTSLITSRYWLGICSNTLQIYKWNFYNKGNVDAYFLENWLGNILLRSINIKAMYFKVRRRHLRTKILIKLLCENIRVSVVQLATR